MWIVDPVPNLRKPPIRHSMPTINMVNGVWIDFCFDSNYFKLNICREKCIDIENLMHPNEALPRNKRINNAAVVNHDETSTFFWQNRAQYTLRNHLTKEHNENIAKNIIFFLGDGMSIPTLTTARIYLGQMHGHNGEESRLSFETFPYIGLAKTYCIDRQVRNRKMSF